MFHILFSIVWFVVRNILEIIGLFIFCMLTDLLIDSIPIGKKPKS
jgi:hypothetical protein